jgi:hypothetical protein
LEETMKLTVQEVLEAAGPQGIAPVMVVEGLGFETALKLAQMARKFEDERRTIRERIDALRTKHEVPEKLAAIMKAHGLPKGTDEKDWPPEVSEAANEALAAFTKEMDELLAANIEVVVEPVAIPKDTPGVTGAMLFNVVKLVKVA